MEVALITVGDEILAGDIENTNGTWLCRQLAARGATVERALTLPDDEAAIERYVREFSEEFDATIVTGGLGGTHDDVTVDAVAAALDRDPVASDEGVAAVLRSMARYEDRDPAELDREDVGLDVAAWGSAPEGARVLPNEEGLCPGCAIDGVYVFPGVPAEMKAMFRSVAVEFAGDAVSEAFHTSAPEAALTDVLTEARDRFDDAAVGSYPSSDSPNRLKVSGTDRERVAEAATWLRERVEVVEPESE
jgi:molybdenum cofactor synthesis domain-containing protein